MTTDPLGADDRYDPDPPPEPEPARAQPGPGVGVARVVGRTLALQAALVAVLLATGRTEHAVLGTAAALPAVAALSVVRVRARTLGGWAVTWLSWRSRGRRAATVSASGDPVNPLWLLDDTLSVGTIRGFRNGEIGVLNTGASWTAVAWVTSGPRAGAQDAPDGLTALLRLPASPAPGVRTVAVLQQESVGTAPDATARMTAWLAVQVEPLRALGPRGALVRVPAMLRAELLRLRRLTAEGVVTVLPLDRSDLLSALAVSTEIPLDPSRDRIEVVEESWDLWHARGRYHHAFELHPGRTHPLGLLVATVMDVVGRDHEAVVTVSLPYQQGRRLSDLPVVRLSHEDPQLLLDLADEVVDALAEQGAATRPLSGAQGPAVLRSSVLVGARRS